MPLSWNVQQVRVTAFPVPGAAVPRTGLWRRFMDAEPEESSSKPLVASESGPFADGTLVIATQTSIRIDLRHTVLQEVELTTPGFCFLGSFPKAIEPLLGLVREKAATCLPTLKRLALGAILIHPAGSRNEAYDQLRTVMEFVPEAERANDFLFQINYQRDSTAMAGLRINRLSKWSVIGVQSVVVSSGVADVSKGSFGCALELDLSSQADYGGTIDPMQIDALLRDLMAGGQEVVAGGPIL